MRTVPFQSILNGVATALGMSPSRDLNDLRAAALTEYINNRVLEAWRFDFWPEWTVCEQRGYRLPWSSVTGYFIGDEVYDPPTGAYYQRVNIGGTFPPTVAGVPDLANWAPSLASYPNTPWVTGHNYAVGDQVLYLTDGLNYHCNTAHTSGGTIDTLKFRPLKAFDKYVAYEQTGKTPIDEVRAVYKRNPRIYTNNPGRLTGDGTGGIGPGGIGFQPSNNGIQVDWRAPALIWVEFRKRPPVFTSTLYSSTTNYATGSLVYVKSSGECYVALQAALNQDPTTQTAFWQKIDFPACIASCVKRAATADGLGDQKQTDRKTQELEEALLELEEACDRALAQQGQFDRAVVSTYGG